MGHEQPTSESGPLADWFQWVEPDVVPQEEKPVGPESDPDDTSADLLKKHFLHSSLLTR